MSGRSVRAKYARRRVVDRKAAPMSVRPRPPLPLPSDQDATGRTLGDEEIVAVSAAIRSGTLTSTKGTFTKALERQFAAVLGVPHCVAANSGTMALHAAFAALDPEPGDEFVTTAITDMGALAPMLYQGVIPTFADVDPRTCNVTPATVEAAIGPRTKAIVATHLFGNPCDVPGILEVANRRGIPVIEDCSQAFLARWGGSYVGTFGAIGCFSLQQGKHITCGEGGLVVTRDPALARRIYLFVNKGWGYGDANPDHTVLAPNGRMSELQAAVAGAQLEKLKAVVGARIDAAGYLTHRLRNLPGIETPWVADAAVHTYWKYCLRVDDGAIAGGASGLAQVLKQSGISSAPRYIQKPAFRCRVFAEQKTFGASRWPFPLARPEAVDYSAERFPGTFRALDRVLVLPWTEKYTRTHLDYIAFAVREAVRQLARMPPVSDGEPNPIPSNPPPDG